MTSIRIMQCTFQNVCVCVSQQRTFYHQFLRFSLRLNGGIAADLDGQKFSPELYDQILLYNAAYDAWLLGQRKMTGRGSLTRNLKTKKFGVPSKVFMIFQLAHFCCSLKTYSLLQKPERVFLVWNVKIPDGMIPVDALDMIPSGIELNPLWFKLSVFESLKEPSSVVPKANL